MATFFLYMCDHTVTTRNPPGGIVIRNCRVRNAARFLRYNFGGETWQKAHPLADITFENCEATGLVCRDVRGLDLSVAKGEGAYRCPAR